MSSRFWKTLIQDLCRPKAKSSRFSLHNVHARYDVLNCNEKLPFCALSLMILADTNTSVQKQTKTILPYRTLKKSQIEPNKRDQRG